MKRKMKKLISLATVCVLGASIMTGCFNSSPQLPDPEYDKEAVSGLNTDVIGEVKLDEMEDDTYGYVFSTLKWGYTAKDLSTALGLELGEASAIGYTGRYMFEVKDFKCSFLGYENTSSTFVFDDDEKLSSMMVDYSKGDYTSADLDTLFDELYAELEKYYGKIELEVKENESGTSTYTSTGAYWNKELSDTQTVSLQLSKADQGEGTMAVVIGCITYNPAEVEEASTEE